MKDYLTIGEISKITNLPISTLRYYDSEGIISPDYKDEKTNYRYYRFFQIPIIKMIVHLKKLGFSNLKIKSHLENLSYSHTLELMNKMIEQTQEEIERLKKIELELKENALQMRYLINLENNIDKFFIEEEEIRGIYAKIALNTRDNGISKAFKEIDKFLISVNQNSIPIGMFAFAMKEENIKKENYEYDKLIYLKDYINYEKRCNYSKREYASMICQGKFVEMGDNIKKVIKWSEEKGYIMKGDTIIHILSGPAFEKDPSEVMYILRIPIKSIN